ncbi:MAG: DUF1385 domain-containing protein [Caldilineae bacterium]|nr:DUF1385 domain-containing protein [Anaerolineae bacterium]MCB0201067.1 DUF1385 domain-containing protein [Anaerolineae bacterium]MCB0204432.1 DUF1385 domain-containing protein [Anaerolineae bacterium]MCB0252451.1 DUF1385 domain-containing protein [Anaerolineae bacterium]MCB9154863.1 DUF1385 domain-containing protein [Caldilineae bacterium]
MSEFFYGGQAVIEGVMMRGRKYAAVAVRNPAGEVVVHQEPLTAAVYTKPWSKWPFVRGVTLLWDALVLGTRSLMWSADVALSEEEEVEFTGPVAWTTVAVSLAIAMAVFFFLPAAVGRWVETQFNLTTLAAAFFEGCLRLGLFLIYIILIGQMPDIRRVFQYHGAEHKTINAYEAGAPLVPERVKEFSLLHPRCGTSFLLGVLVISIFLFAPLSFKTIEGPLGLALRLASRVVLIPVVAGIAYEFLRFSAQHRDHRIMRLLIAPGLGLQKLTTREPDLTMLECAIAALEPVLAADGIVVQEDGVARRAVPDTPTLEEAPLAA